MAASDDDSLSDTWARLMGVFVARRDAFFAALHELQLTPPHGHALMTLRGGPTRMRDLAEQMTCDASYITAVADRLEELGLAERRFAPSDRRARELVLTAKGARVADQLRRMMAEPPEQLALLSERDRRSLARIARQLGEPVSQDWQPSRPVR